MMKAHTLLDSEKKGFTLIELLVVIAVISILAAILFPVFARARENARKASCMSNEKQIALGLMMYAQDYDGRLPNYEGTSPSPVNGFYQAKVYPYVKSEQVFRCPDVGKTSASFESDHYPTYGLIGRQSSVKYNVYAWVYCYGGFPLDSATRPSLTYMLVETQNSLKTYYADYGWGKPYVNFNNVVANKALTAYWATPANTKGIDFKADRHFDGYNVAFLDGHVKWMKFESEAGFIAKVSNQDKPLN